MQVFRADAELDFVVISLLGERIKMKRGNRSLLVITERLSKPARTVSLKLITVKSVEKEILAQQELYYGPPLWLL